MPTYSPPGEAVRGRPRRNKGTGLASTFIILGGTGRVGLTEIPKIQTSLLEITYRDGGPGTLP